MTDPRRRWLIVALTAVITTGLLLAVLHTPWGKRSVLSYASRLLADRYDIQLQADRLDYNLLTLSFELVNVSVGRLDQPERPFASAERVRVDLPWTGVTGPFQLTAIEATDLTVTLVQTEGDGWNLPSTGKNGTPEPAEPFRLPIIGSLVLSRLAVNVQSPEYEVEAPSLELQLVAQPDVSTTLGGTIHSAQPVHVEWRRKTTAINRFDADVTFDGEHLHFDSVEVEAPEGALSVEGRIAALLSAPALDLRYEADIRLSEAARWWRPDHLLDGRVTVNGQLDGPLPSPRITSHLEAETLAWSDLTVSGVQADVDFDQGVVLVEDGHVRVGGGELDMTARVGLGDNPDTNRVEIAWRDIETPLVLTPLDLTLPYSPAGVLTGEGVASWNEWRTDDIRLELDLASTPLALRDGAVPVGGRARAEVSDGQWVALLDDLVIPGLETTGQIQGQLPSGERPMSETTLDGNFSVAVGDAARLVQVFGIDALAASQDTAGLGGRATADLVVSGTMAEPQVRGTVTDSRIGFRGVDGVVVRTDFAAAPRVISLRELTAMLGPNRIAGSVSVSLEASTIDGVLDATLADLADLAPAFPAAISPAGRLDAHLSVSGPLSAPHSDAEIVSEGLTIAGRRFHDITANVTLDRGLLTLSDVAARQNGGDIAAHGFYRLADRAYELDVVARDLSLDALLSSTPESSSLRGLAQVDLTSSGTLQDPRATGVVTMSGLEWSDRQFENGNLTFELEDGRLVVEGAVPALNAVAVGGVGLLGDDTTFDLTVDVTRADLARLLVSSGAAPFDVTGITSVHVAAAGDRTALVDARVDVEVRELDGFVGPTRVRLSDPGAIRYGAGAITTERLELLLDNTRVTLSGSVADDTSSELRAALVGDLSDLEPLRVTLGDAAAALQGLAVNGAVETELVMSGSFRDPTITASIQVRDGALTVGDLPPTNDIDLELAYDMRTVRLPRLRATWQGTLIQGQGELPASLFAQWLPAWATRPGDGTPGGRVSLSFDDISPLVLTPFLSEESLGELEGHAAAQLDIDIEGLSREAIRATLNVSELGMEVAGIPLNQRRETRLEFIDEQLHVRSLDLGNEADYFSLGGLIDFKDEPTADLTVTTELDLRAVGAFVPNIAWEGDSLLIANIQGPLADPLVNGTLEVTDAGMRLADPPLIVSELNGALFLTRGSIQLHELAGEANGGPLRMSGELELVGLQPRGEVSLVSRGMAMELPAGVRTEVDADLTLSLSETDTTVGGTVTVLRGAYRETLTLTSGLLAALQEQETISIVGMEDPSPLDSVNLNIRIVSSEDIILDNNYADATVGFDLRVVGTPASPGVTGRAALAEGGQIRLGNRLYEIETGLIDFINPTEIQPELDLTARTRVSGRDITVTIAGTPDELTTEFQSDPPESESDIVSLLLTGRTIEEVGVAPQAAAAEQALGLVSTEFLGTAGRSVGLDTLRVEQEVETGQIRFDSSLVASETDPSTRLTVGKNLSDQVQVIASQDLVESGQLTWILEYLPRRNIELRFVLDDVNDKSYEFRHAVSLGRPERQLLATAAPRRNLRVVEVSFTGDLGVDEEVLRDRLNLSAGDQFDFYQWQQDRDELEQFYASRDYLQARVRPQRNTTPDGGVSLSFEVVPGPQTLLAIEGYAFPRGVTEQMREAWRRAVFDGFLLDQLSSLARDHLASAGFLQADVEAEIVQTDPAVKEVVLRVSAGPQTDDRRVVFRGNERIQTETLQALIRRQGLTETLWTDREALRRSLRALYESEGMLEARVDVDPPEFTDGVATLPVQIVEGPVFTISSLSVDGVTNRTMDDVTALIGPQSGDVYRGVELSTARVRVDRSYRQLGFNQVRVSVRSTVDTSTNGVSVVFAVDEGPQQVIREIELVGADRTHPQLISRALRLEPGEPVNLGAWNEASKRLYDTGAFRNVDIDAQPLAVDQATVEAGQQPVRATVRLEEWPLYRLRYGLQLQDEQIPLGEQTQQDFSLGLVGDLSRQNFLGRAVTLGSAFRWDTDNRVVRGFGRVPTFFGLPIASSLFVAQEQKTFGEQAFRTTTDLSRLTLEQRVRPRPTMTIAYSYNFERNHTFEVDPDPSDPFGGFDETINVARLAAGIVLDSRDDLFDPTRGWFHSSSVEYAPETLGSELRFAKYTVQQFHYWPVGGGVVVASAARLGLAAAFGQDLILNERFFAGGGNTVRGYRQDALGPLFLGQPDGGNASVVLNQEVRFPIFGFVRGVGFLDAGNIFPLVEEFTLKELKVGAGLGLRFDTPFGLFRLDFAVPLSEIDEELKSRFFFSIGQVF